MSDTRTRKEILSELLEEEYPDIHRICDELLAMSACDALEVIREVKRRRGHQGCHLISLLFISGYPGTRGEFPGKELNNKLMPLIDNPDYISVGREKEKELS